MRYLDKYSIFESSSYENIINNLNDILLELNDDGFICEVRKQPSVEDAQNQVPNISIPGGFKIVLVKTHDVINIIFYKPSIGFVFDDIKEVYYRIKEYLKSNDYSEVEGLSIEDKYIKLKNTNDKIKGAGNITRLYTSFYKKL